MTKIIEIDVSPETESNVLIKWTTGGRNLTATAYSFEEATQLRDLLNDALKPNPETDHRIAGAGC